MTNTSKHAAVSKSDIQSEMTAHARGLGYLVKPRIHTMLPVQVVEVYVERTKRGRKVVHGYCLIGKAQQFARFTLTPDEAIAAGIIEKVE